MFRQFVIALALVAPGQVQAQPYSESMADCAALYQNAAQWVRRDDRAEKLMIAARTWHAAAVKQARAEGRALSDDAMWNKIDRKTAAWEEKGARFVFSEEFLDWTRYCAKFAKHTGTKISF